MYRSHFGNFTNRSPYCCIIWDLQKAHLHTLVGITMVDLITVHFLYELIAGLNTRGLTSETDLSTSWRRCYCSTFQWHLNAKCAYSTFVTELEQFSALYSLCCYVDYNRICLLLDIYQWRSCFLPDWQVSELFLSRLSLYLNVCM